jgi:transcriptional regulator with XRE-family HTH domain
MADKDLLQLRQVLNKAVKATGLTAREIERRLGVGSGNLYRVIDGSLDLRIRHLIALADLLGVPPTDFLEMGCPSAMQRATGRLSDHIGASTRKSTSPATAATLSIEQLTELIRNTVREELDRPDAKPARQKRS